VAVKERGHKELGRKNAIWQFMQLNGLFILGPWTTLEHTTNPYHTRVLLATYGLAYSFEVISPLPSLLLWMDSALNLLLGVGFRKLTSCMFCPAITFAIDMQMSKLIMSHMSKESFHLSYWPMLAMASTLANSYLHLLPAFPLALLVNCLVLAGYLHYVSSVVVEICDYLNIKCFSIPVLPEEEAKG